jgi:hypothetical protein
MSRIITAIVTALWLAPLLGWRIGLLFAAASVRSSGTQITAAERGMGESLVLLGGGGARRNRYIRRDDCVSLRLCAARFPSGLTSN